MLQTEFLVLHFCYSKSYFTFGNQVKNLFYSPAKDPWGITAHLVVMDPVGPVHVSASSLLKVCTLQTKGWMGAGLGNIKKKKDGQGHSNRLILTPP